ncbi:exodeoxyribonuclease V subunit alpha [Gracilimonas sp. Q87]|uniref:exodeoxyribonuclease V subunit alpha n=1 Tax=Gracilimonas sp. Q87 TaxID=3384766 RepID=UPI0039844E17
MSTWKTLQNWKHEGLITDVELEYARFLRQLDPAANDEILLAGTACIFAQKNGHICIDLNKPTNEPLFDEDKTGIRLDTATFEKWLNSLGTSELVSKDGSLQPLVMEEGRLYLHKFWKFEEELTAWIRNRAKITNEITENEKKVIAEFIKPKKEQFVSNWQEVALCLSFIKNLIVISGGPGTGKTHTVLNIITAQLLSNQNKNYNIALTAPTGKAARRLIDSIEEGKESLPNHLKEEIVLPESAMTVHKLLGASYRSNTFQYDNENHLPHDIVVVDEASMLDINMWVRLVRAIGPNTKLVVLGDKDQLASVEAGSILGDICAGENSYSNEVATQISDLTGTAPLTAAPNTPAINDCVVFLTKSYRFSDDSGIKKLADAINDQNSEAVLNLLQNEDHPDLKWIEPKTNTLEKIISKYGLNHFEEYSANDEKRMEASNSRKILCAIRKTKYGVESINQLVEIGIKRKNSLIISNDWYDGRLVMATKNDAALRIRNGEMGIFNIKEDKIQFEGEHNFSISPSRLADYESAYAITIHKSQGSEFEDVAIMLPESYSDVLSKEILYTAVTRARKNTLVFGSKDVIQKTVERSVNRQSGVKGKIWSS